MNSNNTKDELTLFKTVVDGVDALGLELFIESIKSAIQKKSNSVDNLSSKIINISCEELNINWDDIQSQKRFHRKDFLSLCIIAALLKKYALISQKDISILMNRTKPMVTKYINTVSRAGKSNYDTEDVWLSEKYSYLSNKIKSIIITSSWKKKESEEDQGK